MTAATQIVDQTIPALGLALFAALLLAKIAHHYSIPKVSAFILTGVILGPGVFNLLTPQILDEIHYIKDVALGLILFNIGGSFDKALFAKMDRKIILFNVAIALIVFTTVFSFLSIYSSLYQTFSLSGNLVLATFLGIIAMDAAPPSTLLVIKEYNAKGPVTNSIMVYLAISICLSIVAFRSFDAILIGTGHWNAGHSTPFGVLCTFFWAIFGSVFLGIIFGMVLTLWERKERQWGDTLFVVTVGILLGQAICFYLKLEPLLFGLFFGLSVINSSTVGEKIHLQMKDMGHSIYALFFILAGAHIQLNIEFSAIGLLSVVYIVARSLGHSFAPRLALHFFDVGEKHGKFQGPSLLSHAGAAIAIISPLESRNDPLAHAIFTTVMTSIFIFEIVGPLAVKFCLTSAGEIESGDKDSQLTFKSSHDIKEIFNNFLTNIRLKKENQIEEWVGIKALLKTDILAIQGNAKIKNVINFIKDDSQIYPVVDENQIYLGTISIEALKAVIVEDHSQFVFAKDLIGAGRAIWDNATLAEASEIFSHTKEERLPVVGRESKTFLGVLHNKDVALSMEKQKEKAKNILIS